MQSQLAPSWEPIGKAGYAVFANAPTSTATREPVIVAIFHVEEAAHAALDQLTEHLSCVIWSTSWDAQAGNHLSSDSREVRPFPLICDLRDLMMQGREARLQDTSTAAGENAGVGSREARPITLDAEQPTSSAESPFARRSAGTRLAATGPATGSVAQTPSEDDDPLGVDWVDPRLRIPAGQ